MCWICRDPLIRVAEAGGADCGRYRGTRRSRRFLDYFKDLPDRQQRGKVLYPLDEVLLLRLVAVPAVSEAIIDIVRIGENNSSCYGCSARFATEPFPTATSATFWRRSCFVAALTGTPSDVSPSTATGRAGRRKERRRRSIWFRASRRANHWCLGK